MTTLRIDLASSTCEMCTFSEFIILSLGQRGHFTRPVGGSQAENHVLYDRVDD